MALHVTREIVLHSRPYTLNPNSETRNPKPGTLILKPETRNPEPGSSGKLQLQSWELAGQRRGNLPAYGGRLGLECTEAGALHETAAGRGTVIHVLDDGNVCQVRWDATGLVDTYNTGRHGEYSLQTWGTESQASGGG